jgi:hypothetical protein
MIAWFSLKKQISQIFGIPAPSEQIIPEQATYDELQAGTTRIGESGEGGGHLHIP